MALLGRGRKASAQSPADLEIAVLQASAAEVRLEDGRDYRRTLPAWQRQVLELYDLLGEEWYPAQFYARMLSRVRLHPARELPNGEHEEIEDEQAQKILKRIQSRRWLGTYGQLQFLIGDGYLAVSLDDDGQEQWEYLSPAELVVQDTSFLRRMGEGVPDRTYSKATSIGENGPSEGEMKAWRLWNRHPTHSEMADSPVKAVIDRLTYLMHLDKAALAQAVSRIVGAGLFVVDERITLPPSSAEEANEDTDEDPFMRRLTSYMVKPISTPGSAAQQAPLVARVEPPEGMNVKEMTDWIRFHDPNQTTDWEAKVEKTIRRIAIALDMPPAELLGLENANQWVGWLIGEDKWKAHGEPVIIRACDDLTRAYYRPACMAAGVANAEELIVWFDPAQVVVHPDHGKAAEEVHDRGALSDKALRSAHNFAESDAPTAAERATWETIKLRRPERPQDPSAADARGSGAHVQPGAPEQNGNRTNQPSPQADNQQMRILGAADVMFDQLRQRAGTFLWTRKMQCDGCFDGLEEVPRGELAATVGRDVVQMLDVTSELALIVGGADVFATKLQKQYGYSENRAQVIAKVLERLAAESLYEPEASLPADFVEVL